MGKYIVTAAWPYVNYVPHLGTVIHLISADIYARYLRLRGHQVIYVTGSDEHGTPIELEARKKGVSPRELTDAVHAYDLELFKKLEIEFSNYSRTESETHKKFVKEFFMKLYERGFIFEQVEILPYCENDKMFLPDRFVEGTCPYCGNPRARGDQCDECGRLLYPTLLLNPRCSICGSKPVYKSSKHWFIDLTKVRDQLLSWLESNKELQDNVREYSLSWVSAGLKPRSVTRDLSWGIEAPFPGSQDKTIYVWFDALLGYVSATIEYFEKYKQNSRPDEWKEWWMDRETKSVYFIGKDNIPFHSIILPALFIASGEPYVMPWRISATEYLLYEGQHFSKSRRVGVWLDEALEIAPGEYWRWVIARLRPEARDQNFTWTEFYRIVNSELNDDIGNYVSRVLSLIDKIGGSVEKPEKLEDIDEELVENSLKTSWEAVNALDDLKFKTATDKILELARMGNRFLNERAPWTSIQSRKEEAISAIYASAYVLKNLAILLAPFMPRTAERLWSLMGLEGDIWSKIIDEELPKRPPVFRSRGAERLFTKLPPDFLKSIDLVIEEARARAEKKRPKVIAEVR
ncbi:MAG: methionine--tRNA ligase [Acidilobaceae archaeon]